MQQTGAETLDIPVEFEFKGKVYKVSRKITFQMEQMCADWVYQSALDRLERQRALARETGRGMTEEQYEKQLAQISNNLSAGKFDWEGSITQEAMQQWAGHKFLTLLRFKRYPENGQVTMALIEELFSPENHDHARRLGRLLNPTPPVAAGNEEKKSQEQQAGNKEDS